MLCECKDRQRGAQVNACTHQLLEVVSEEVQRAESSAPLESRVLGLGEQWGPDGVEPHAALWPSASALPAIWFPTSGPSLHSSLLCDLQMNGTRPGTVSTKLSPWDKSSHSAHRVDLSTV